MQWGKLKGPARVERYFLERGFTSADARGKAGPPRTVCTIEYDFKEVADRDAWYANFLLDGDGFKETADAPGIKVCHWYRAIDSPTKVGFYEEWDCKESQLAYAKQRFASGFLQRWFDLSVGEGGPVWGKLKEEGGFNVQYFTLANGVIQD